VVQAGLKTGLYAVVLSRGSETATCSSGGSEDPPLHGVAAGFPSV